MSKSPRIFWIVFVVATCVLVTPLFMVEIPPVADYPNHLARLYVLAHGASDPVLSRMYAPHWDIIPNLGIDLLVPWTLSFIPLHVAGRIMLAATLLLPVLGTIAYSRALFGGGSFWPLGSFIVAYNIVFLFGFHNLLLSYGAALLSSALHYKYMKRGILTSDSIGALCAIVVFFIHIAGLALLFILIFSHKIFHVIRFWPDGKHAGREAVLQGCGFGIIALGPFGLYLASPLADAVGRNFWIGGPAKLIFLLGPVLNYYPKLDLVTAALMIAVFILCIMSGRTTVSPPVSTSVAALFIAYPYLPFATMTATYVDVRVPIALGFLVFCIFIPRNLPKPIIVAVSLILLSLFVLRTVVVARVWYDHRQDLADLRRTIEPIEAGSRVLVVSVKGPGAELFMPEGDPDLQPGAPRSRFLSIIGIPTYEHMAALVLIERHAFWPLLFAYDNKQPLRVLSPYRELSFPTGGRLPNYEGLALDDIPATDLEQFPYVANWRSRFDYVLVLNAGLAGDLRSFLTDRLVFLEQTGFTALFRIRK